MAQQFGSITVGELIARLQEEDPEAEVCFSSDYGDIGHTMQLHEIRGQIDEQEIEESAYSASGWAIAEREQDRDDEPFADPEPPKILVIR